MLSHNKISHLKEHWYVNLYLFHPKTEIPYRLMENWINSGLEIMLKQVEKDDEEFIYEVGEDNNEN